MQPRYAEGTGSPPIHVASVKREQGGRGTFIFGGVGGEGHKVEYASNAECLEIFRNLLTESVPLSIGGHCNGPADEVALLISNGELHGSYIEISWSGPGKWTLREIGKGTPPWERVADLRHIANTTYNPNKLKRAGDFKLQTVRMQRITKVEHTFLVTGRGLVVMPGPLRSEVASGSDIPVELRLPDGTVRSAFATLQHVFQSPPPPRHIAMQWGCILSGVTKEQVPLGTEVWGIDGAEFQRKVHQLEPANSTWRKHEFVRGRRYVAKISFLDSRKYEFTAGMVYEFLAVAYSKYDGCTVFTFKEPRKNEMLQWWWSDDQSDDFPSARFALQT